MSKNFQMLAGNEHLEIFWQPADHFFGAFEASFWFWKSKKPCQLWNPNVAHTWCFTIQIEEHDPDNVPFQSLAFSEDIDISIFGASSTPCNWNHLHKNSCEIVYKIVLLEQLSSAVRTSLKKIKLFNGELNRMFFSPGRLLLHNLIENSKISSSTPQSLLTRLLGNLYGETNHVYSKNRVKWITNTDTSCCRFIRSNTKQLYSPRNRRLIFQTDNFRNHLIVMEVCTLCPWAGSSSRFHKLGAFQNTEKSRILQLVIILQTYDSFFSPHFV